MHSGGKLLDLISQGDEKAFTSLFHQYQGKVFSIARHITKSSEIAEEAVQEIFMKIWESRAKLSGVQNIESYLFITTRNHVFDVLKKQARQLIEADKIQDPTAFALNKGAFGLLEQENNELLQEAISQLPPQQRNIFIMARQEGKSQEEIAEILNISPLTVKKHMSYALKSIKEQLQRHLKLIAWWIIILHFIA
ncbi:RNA polymerase sigma-70 factor [Fulvivirga maritima]|uniref:RNA polymerase sigma factor n=1 Tax=Fulvivirga maritima TaxID=2904247 RepID=UPI001F39F579|nr:RNA polymerase sigma-70 factor [Fulvivirga maritima]UII24714.1 RNA polymerase sigma-70 factor [Fulvivirga maritima]